MASKIATVLTGLLGLLLLALPVLGHVGALLPVAGMAAASWIGAKLASRSGTSRAALALVALIALPAGAFALAPDPLGALPIALWLAIAATPIATCHSRLSAERLRGEGFRGILLVSPGLIDGVAATTPPRPAAEPPFVLFAGRHIADKRVESLPAAVAAARTDVPGLELVMLGQGATTEQIRSEVARVDGDAWTRMPGFVGQEELDELMSGAICLTNPSRREGYGLVVVEAAAHGTPVVLVADEGNAATELVDEGVNGFVAASAAAEDLAAAIVACAHAGDRLRDSTYQWYQDAVQTRTIARTMDAIVRAIDGFADPVPPNEGHRS